MILTLTFTAFGLPEPFDLPLLDHAQQLDLDVEGQVADLVEKDRRVVRQFEAADLSRQRAGEGPLLAAEQFALDERARNRGAVDAHHDAAVPRALFVNLRGDEFLAGAGFTEQQHRRIGGGDLTSLLEDALDGSGFPDDDAGAEPLLYFAAKVLILCLQIVVGARFVRARRNVLVSVVRLMNRHYVGRAFERLTKGTGHRTRCCKHRCFLF